MRPAPMAAPNSTRPSGVRLRGFTGAVFDGRHPRVPRAAGAAEVVATGLDAVAYHLAAAVLARGREAMDRALEGIEGVVGAGHVDVEGLVVIVTTDLAASHGRSPPFILRGAFRVPLRRLFSAPAGEPRQDLVGVKPHEAS